MEWLTVETAEERFTRLYDDRYPAILAYFMRRVDSTANAQDLTEDVFLVAWSKLAEVPDGDEGGYWLYGVARRVLANHLRKMASRAHLLPRMRDTIPKGLPPPDDQLVRNDEARAIHEALASLREKDRELIQLAYWDELPHRVIGRLLGCSRGAVDVRLHRALRRLRKATTDSGHSLIEELTARAPKEKPC